jgi:hypothetical protein
MRRTLIVLLITAALWWLWPERALRHPPGVIVAIPPIQTKVEPRVLAEFKGYRIQAQAAYLLQARVLRTKRYYGQGGDLVPYDVALAWGPMSDQRVLDRLKISQTNRFFFYWWQDAPPIPPAAMESHAANVHVISADKPVAKAVSSLRGGQIVTMKGYLVNVSKADGFHWNSSLTRDDSGNGACELFYVEAIRISDRPTAPATATRQAAARTSDLPQ